MSSLEIDLPAAARVLLGEEPVSIQAVAGGGNNRMYRVVDSRGAPFALKLYPRHASDPRDRLGAEFEGLTFLSRHGVANVPRPVVADRESGAALYEWLDGSPLGQVGPADIEAALAFTERLRDLSRTAASQDLQLASEACLSGAEIARQIARRLSRLSEVAERHPLLKRFLNQEFAPAYTRAIAAAMAGFDASDLGFEQELPAVLRCLSPSDFGFHNALRLADGTLAFVDFEYFGWDDPVKLVADFLLHPGMDLAEEQRERFRAGALALFATDRGFATRLSLLFPLFGLRWCMIILNEFLPERWLRRQFAGATDIKATQDRQLNKARHYLSVFDRELIGL